MAPSSFFSTRRLRETAVIAGLLLAGWAWFPVFEKAGPPRPVSVREARAAPPAGDGDQAREPLPAVIPVVSGFTPAASVATALAPALNQIPAGEQASFQAALHEAFHGIHALKEAETGLRAEKVPLHALNPENRLSFVFQETGAVRLRSGKGQADWEGSLRLAGVGNDCAPPSISSWKAAGTRAERQAEGLTEWYVNRREGMEHGFTLTKRPSCSPLGSDGADPPALLRFSLDGLMAAADPDRQGDLVFLDPASGQSVAGYRNLKVWDADGKGLAAEMRPSAEGFLIAVNDAAARYPVTVDPLIVTYQKGLTAEEDGGPETASGEPAGAHFGLSVDIDGDTAVVGALDYEFYERPAAGGAWVFRRTGTTWSLEDFLHEATPRAHDRFGVSVAVSGDRIVVGADFDDGGFDSQGNPVNPDLGSASIFERTGGVWSQAARSQGSQSGDSFGRSVAIDGTTVVIGAPGALSREGKVYTLHKSSTGWHEGGGLTALPYQAESQFGFSVAVSGDRFIVGAPRTDAENGLFQLADTGRIFYFRRAPSSNNWVRDGWNGPLKGKACAGFSVALDGDTAVVGCSGPSGWAGTIEDAGRTGEAFVVSHDGTAWSSTFQYLDNSGLPAESWFGMSVAVEDDLIAVGAFGNSTLQGAVRLFLRQGSAWVKQQDFHWPGASDPGNAFGVSTALSGDTLVVGAYGVDTFAGGPDAGVAGVYRIGGLPPPPLTITRNGPNAVLTWRYGSGLALWKSPTMQAGSWIKIPGTEQVGTHSSSMAGAPRMFFRLAPPDGSTSRFY